MDRNFSLRKKLNGFASERAAGTAFTVAVIAVLASTIVYYFLSPALSSEKSGDISVYLGFLLPSVFAGAAVLAPLRSANARYRHGETADDGSSAIGAYFNLGFKKRYYAVIVLLTVGMLFGLGELNGLFIKLLNLFGYVEKQTVLPPYSLVSLTVTTLVVAVIPPLVEETIFRAVIGGGLKKYGYISIIVTAALFSLYHMNPSKTIYQFVVGLLFSLIFLKSGSVIPSIVVHFLNNLLIILNYYFGVFSFVESAPILFTALGLICLAASLVITFTDKRKIEKAEDKEGLKIFFLFALIGIVAAAIIWVASLLS